MKLKAVSGTMLTLLLVSALTLTFNIQQVKTQEEGLIAYYPFNGNANDESGNGNDGTVYGATLTEDRFGNPNSAYSFDGIDDYLEVPHDADFDFGTGAFTVSAWINTNATTTSGSGRDEILSKGDATISGFAISIENNKAAFWVGPSGELFGSSVLNDGEWHQIVGTRDDSGNVTLYVDGMIESTGINNQNVNTTYSVFVGKHGTMSESYFDGLIDDVRIHNRAVTPHGVFLSPSFQVGYDLPGATVSYTLKVINRMGMDDSFDLSVSGNAWPTNLSISNTGTIGDGESVSFTTSVAIPSSVSPGDTDTATVTTTSTTDPTVTDTAAVTTTATSGEYAYVAVSPYDYVALVDRAINQVVGTINVGASGGHWPWRIAIEPGGQYVYVSCRDSDNIVVIARESNSIFTVVSDPALNRPHGMSFTYDGAYALVGSRDASQIVVVDTSTHAVVETIAVSSPPTSIATSPTGIYAYATSRWDDKVFVIDLDSMSVVDTIFVGSNPWDVVVSPGGELAYVTNRWDSTVSVIDTSTNLVIHTITNVGNGPHGLEISPDGSYLYVAGGWSGAVHVIDCTSNMIVANLGIWPGRFDFVWDVAVTCEGDFIYVTNSKNERDTDGLQVCCIDTSTNFFVATVSMPDSDGDGYPDWGARGLAICHVHAFEHELVVSLEAPDHLAPSDSSLLEATVYNRGLSNETNVELYLLINGTAVNSATIPKLLTGESYTINYSWTPTVEATYNVTGYAPPVPGENVTTNNLKSRMVYVRYIEVALISDYSELLAITAILDSMGIGYDVYNDNSIYLYTENLDLLLNYETVIFYTDYRHITSNEYTALESYLSSGGSLLVTGFDSLVSDDLLRDIIRSATMGDNVGEPDLYVVDETHPIMNGPYGSFPAGYHLSGLYGDCDAVEADTARMAVTVAELASGYDKIIATDGLLGTVVYWNGVGPEDWMWNVECEAIFKNTLAWFLIQYEHELAVRLDAPTFLEPGESSLLNATVYNRGLSNETSVGLSLSINGTVVDSATIPTLVNGSSYTLSYLWTPTQEAMYNVTAYGLPVLGENITANNIAQKMVHVRPIKGYILFDQTHWTDSIIDYAIWMSDLIYRGYIVDTLTTSPIPQYILERYDAFVIPQAHECYSPEEISAIQDFVLDGGGLLVIGNDDPYIYTDLTGFAGITWNWDGYGGGTSDITLHPVTEGVSAAYFDSPVCSLDATSPAIDIIRDSYGYIMLAASEIGSGKALGIADEHSINDGYIYYADNLQLANNMIDWLTVRYEHDLATTIDAPTFLRPGDSSLLNATVYNRGLGNETDVELFLLIKGTEVESVVIPELLSGSFYTLSHLWIPTVKGIYNVTVYAPPVPDENITINNIATKMVSSGMVFNPVADIRDPTSQIYMDQLWYNFTSPPTEVGDTFYVDVIGYNISEVFAYQVVIDYDAALLSCLEAWPDGGGWTDPDWIFYDLQTWGLTWSSYADQPSAGRSAVLIGDALKNEEDEVSLTDPASEALLARFEFEILAVPEPYEELSCVISITSSWAVGTYVQSGDEAVDLKKRSPVLTDSFCNIKWVSPPEYTLTIYSSPSGVTFTVDGVSYTSPWSGTYSEGTSISLVMPEIHDGYVWSHWLGDNDTSRTKTVTLDTNITLTGVFALLSDLDGDGFVGISDISVAAVAFGSFPEHPRWNSIADLNKDGWVDIADVAKIAVDFGKTV